jgi:hypothetical protein
MKSLAPCHPLLAVAGATTGASTPHMMLLFSSLKVLETHNNLLKIIYLFTILIEHEFTERGNTFQKLPGDRNGGACTWKK